MANRHKGDEITIEGQRNLRNPKVKPHYCYGSTFKLQKLHHHESHAQKLEKYYNAKYGQIVTPIAILKTLAVVSSTFKNNVKIWVLHIAPSRQLKSKTSEEQMLIFPKKRIVNVGSDFTIHGLIRDYGDDIDSKCLLINDLTLLLASKASRTKARLIDALSELASEGRYTYLDYQKTMTIAAKFSLIANITPTSFLYNRRGLLDNTFVERCLTVYHELTEEEMTDANLNRAKRNSIKIERFKRTINERDVEIRREDDVRFNEYARRWRILGAYTSSSSLFDIIKSIAVAYAILSGHREITSEEYRYLDVLEPYICSPFENVKLTILELARQGRSIRDICLILDQNYDTYRPFVSRVINEYRRKGVLTSAGIDNVTSTSPKVVIDV
jgi:hypothetical protein